MIENKRMIKARRSNPDISRRVNKMCCLMADVELTISLHFLKLENNKKN